jgi:hypothetical protein
VTVIDNNAFANCSSLTIYAQAKSRPAGWNADWNPGSRPVIWGSPEAYFRPIATFSIPGVTAPAVGAAPVKKVQISAQYTGTVAWDPSHVTFAEGTIYTATITLTAKEGYTFQGVSANSFTVAGAASTSNAVNSGLVTAVFPPLFFSGGAGTSTNPFLIKNAADLDNIRLHPDRFYKLANDIVLDTDIWYSQGLSNWTPIPTFSGVLDGNGKTIHTIKMKTSSSGKYGLVAVNNGTIKNMNIEACISVLHGNVSAGLFVGLNNGTIMGCTSNKRYAHYKYIILDNRHSIPDSISYLGGIAGTNTGTIQDCQNHGIIETESSAGGIAGFNNGRIEGSQNYGNINYTFFYTRFIWNANIGGIAGYQNTNGQSNAQSKGTFSCKNFGKIKYAGAVSISTELQPAMAQIVGYNQVGNLASNSWKYLRVTGTVDKGTLQVVGTHNQALYVGDREAGR